MKKAGLKKAKGFSLIELLVAVLVMGIGVLGISGLQLVSLQNNRGALYRAEGVQLAYDMLDRIRANPAGAIPGLAYDGIDMDDGPPGAADCNANVCTQAQMVTFDQAVWKCTLGGFHEDGVCEGLRNANVLPPTDQQPGLPNGDGSISVNAGTGIITVSVRWSENNNQIRTIVIESQG